MRRIVSAISVISVICAAVVSAVLQPPPVVVVFETSLGSITIEVDGVRSATFTRP